MVDSAGQLGIENRSMKEKDFKLRVNLVLLTTVVHFFYYFAGGVSLLKILL